jgi:hypothetical protein
MERGDFYGSTGVELEDVVVTESTLEIQIRPERGVTYETEFIGTVRGFDQTATPLPDVEGLPVTRRYSPEIGTVLATVPGITPRYRLTGNELYVRARVRSSRPKSNPYREGEVEMAWVQPVVPSGTADRRTGGP